MSAVEETPELQADLPDVLRMVARLAHIKPMGREGRQILFALANAAHDVEKFDGLVVEGEVYNARWRQEWASCGCKDGRHAHRKDGGPWFGRGWWHEVRADAESDVKRYTGHLVTHLTAVTSTEVVR